MHDGTQIERQHIAGDNFFRLGVADDDLVTLRRRIAFEQDRRRTRRSDVLVKIGLAGFRRKFRLTRVEFRDDADVVVARQAALASATRPGIQDRVEALDRLDLTIAFGQRELERAGLVGSDHIEIGQPLVGRSFVQREIRERADIERDRNEVLIARIHLGDDDAHDRIALELIKDVDGGRTEQQRRTDEARTVVVVADAAAYIRMKQLSAALYERIG